MSHDIGSSVCARHPIHVACAGVFDLSLRPSLCSLHLSSCRTLTSTFSSSMCVSSEQDSLCTSPNEESGPLAEFAPLTGYEPKLPDDFHYSETTEIIFQEHSTGAVPSYVFDAELDDETISGKRSLHHCSFRNEKNQRAVEELVTLLTKVCRPVSRRLSVIEQGDLLWNSLIHESEMSEKIRAAAQKVSKAGFFWNDKESRLSLIVKRRFENTSSRPIMAEEVFKN